MKRFIMSAAFVSVLVAVFSLSGRLYSQEKVEAPQPAAKIGVVDLLKLSKEFKKWTRLEEQLQAAETKMNKKLLLTNEEILNLNKCLKLFKEGSEEHTKTKIQLIQKEAERKRFRAKEAKQLQELAEKSMRELLHNILGIIEEYGKENSYTLIARKGTWSLKGKDWSEIQYMVLNNAVLYSAQGTDLTEEIIEILNEKYK